MAKKAKTKTKTKKPKRTSPKKTTARGSLKKKPRTRSAGTAPPFNTGGTIVGGTDPCACGHAPEEHGRDAAHPGSTSCVVCEDGDCVAYEADLEL